MSRYFVAVKRVLYGEARSSESIPPLTRCQYSRRPEDRVGGIPFILFLDVNPTLLFLFLLQQQAHERLDSEPLISCTIWSLRFDDEERDESFLKYLSDEPEICGNHRLEDFEGY